MNVAYACLQYDETEEEVKKKTSEEIPKKTSIAEEIILNKIKHVVTAKKIIETKISEKSQTHWKETKGDCFVTWNETWNNQSNIVFDSLEE